MSDAIKAARSRGAIVIVIAHRPSAIAAVDMILVMKQGEAVAFGPKDELLSPRLHSSNVPKTATSSVRGRPAEGQHMSMSTGTQR